MTRARKRPSRPLSPTPTGRKPSPAVPAGRADGLAATLKAAGTVTVRGAACTAVALAHVAVLAGTVQARSVAGYSIVLVAPAAVTALCRRMSLKRWWRFLALFATLIVVAPAWFEPTFVASEAWIFYRSWIVESDPKDLHPLRSARRRLRPSGAG